MSKDLMPTISSLELDEFGSKTSHANNNNISFECKKDTGADPNIYRITME